MQQSIGTAVAQRIEDGEGVVSSQNGVAEKNGPEEERGDQA